jgi:hypothetical protein
MSRNISNKIKTIVLERQQNKCAQVKNYTCLLWLVNMGYFDEAGYEFDHIDEYSITKDNSSNNIQALCPNCHSVKTKRFRHNKNLFTSREIEQGSEIMDIDKVRSQKRKIKDYNIMEINK